MKRWTFGRSGWRTVAVAGMIAVFSAGAAHAASSPPPANVAKSPVCDPSTHPKIMKIMPDTVKPGDKITIKGKNFGTKQCFRDVSFGSSVAKFSYVNETTLEATVPAIKSGLSPVHIRTEAGTSEYVVLVQTK